MIYAQSNDTAYPEYNSTHYSIRTQGTAQNARTIAIQLEAMYRFFNNYFHFPTNQENPPLRVLIFSSRQLFDEHIQSLVNVSYDGFIYLHYGRPQRNELIGFVSDDAEVASSFVRQAFLQFLRAHITNPPLWLSEGFSTYVRNATYNPQTQSIMFNESISRAKSLQIIIERSNGKLTLPIESVLTSTRETLQQNSADFYHSAWGLIAYLLNTDEADHARILWGSIARLMPSASFANNQETLQTYEYDWINYPELENAIVSYIKDYETPYILLGRGQKLMQEEKYAEAEKTFARVIELDSEESSGYYYRGLANYHQKNYVLAIAFYEEAIHYGLDENFGLFAIALSRYALNERDTAIELLGQIPATSQYYNRAQDLLSQWSGN